MIDLFKLVEFLKNNYKADILDKYWWQNSGSFEVVITSILTQQSKWEKVQLSIQNLKKYQLLEINALANISFEMLSSLIKPSGFYNQKAKNIILISQNIKNEYENFENFKQNVSKEWLINQKGIGLESCDSILCYGCYHEVMVVDNYTKKLLNILGYEFENYHEIQNFLVEQISLNFNQINKLYNFDISLCEFYARFHGKIVEFAKQNFLPRNNIKEKALNELKLLFDYSF